MASIYTRDDSQELWLSCYPQPSKLVRATLGTDDPKVAEQIRQKVELLIKLERLGDVRVPEKVLAAFAGLPMSPRTEAPAKAEAEPPAKEENPGALLAALKAYVTRSATGNVHASLNNKLSQLRQFFGSALVDTIDPRPIDHRRHARRRDESEPWFAGNSLAEITPDALLSFLHDRNYGRSSRRHYRELFHDLFRVAMVNGLYVPSNPYAPNPASELPSYKGTDEPIVVLDESEIERQYSIVARDPKLLFGCQVMIEGGFRLHEALSLKRRSIAEDYSHIRLLLPRPASSRATKLKTGERTVTVRPELAEHLRRFLSRPTGDWLIPAPSGVAWSSNAFGDALRKLNRASGVTWTTQDFRHTFATARIKEGWNLKTLAEEMGTSVQMLMEHYAGYIAPPVHAARSSANKQIT